MTDKITGTQPQNDAGQNVVERTSFEKEGIWLPQLALQHWNAGQMFIEGKTFTDCLIEGPAVMAVMNNTHFENCAMGTTTDVRVLLYRPVSREKMAGVIGMSNCRFVRCRFVQVGFTGSEEMIAELEAGVRPLSETAAKTEPSA